ncbi:YbhB/YbcL family Raf kinase inhibitor-like protein [Mucilaginibacter agri]|uniref:YbhB/YbcL family Raf kinase inhibitor-like protein n=1 Tax=Mucilaginibacter agri TaxID=2695265 RepID=A0A966DS15_9SPHI|nr:YbhB/YbcL family Raf kinase inhibitor-like protein [Mucilaginibacter agri]NCD67777.1 YbhB/YbcL family Raf kinase inhibitor-like protein [Mucilaginibacter agri]
MKTIFVLITCLFVSAAAFCQTFTLKSNDLGGQFTNEFVAGNFGCNGSNQSPQLSWVDAPDGTQSFAITMYDPDALTGSGFWHWVIVDIPTTVHELKKGAGDIKSNIAPVGSLQSINDTGYPGYQGPCPGEGEAAHHYLITVYALKTAKLGTTSSSTAALTGFLLGKQVLAKASLMVYCKR